MIGSRSEFVGVFFTCLPVLRMGASFDFGLATGVKASTELALLIRGFLATPFFGTGAGGFVVDGVALLAVAVLALVTRGAAGITEGVFMREDALVAGGLLAIGK
jgi:hypothetical protein